MTAIRPIYERHGLCPAGSGKSREYSSWCSMRSRILNSTDKSYSKYGGRGLTICPRWDSFTAFLSDMGPRPQRTTLERTNNKLGYMPSNCKWGTPREQTLNRSATIMLEFNGKRQCVYDWARELGISRSSLRQRLKQWPVAVALSFPKMLHGKQFRRAL